MPFILLVCLLLLGCVSISANAQNAPLVSYEFYHIQQPDGLSFNVTNCLFEDRDGFLWIGTNSGLNRFDGHHFTVFKHKAHNPNSLGNNTIHDICQDKAGHLWLATDEGISEFVPQTGRFRSFQVVNGNALGSCYNILCDRSGQIWFTSKETGLYRYQPDQRTFKRYAHDPHNPCSLSENYIARNGLVEDPRRNGLWLATRRSGGLNYLDMSSGQFQNYRHNPNRLPIYAPHYTSALALDGPRLIFSDNSASETGSRILVYDLNQERIVRTIEPVSRSGPNILELLTIFVDRQHHLWLSSWQHRMFMVKAGTNEITELAHDENRRTSIGGSTFSAGYQQADGTIWLATGHGLSCTNPQRALYDAYDLARLYPALKQAEGIDGFCEDTDRTWWLKTRRQGLLHFNPFTNRLDAYPTPEAPPQYPGGVLIRKLFAYGPNELLMASLTHLLRFNKRTKQFRRIRLPAYFNQIEATTIQLQGDRLWVFGFGKHAYCYHLLRDEWQHYSIPSQTSNPYFYIRLSLVDNQNRLWLDLHPEGFARFDPQQDRFVLQKGQNEPTTRSVFASLVEDGQGCFWATIDKHGLTRYDPRTRRYRYWTETDGLAYNHVLAALPDTRGNVWVAAHNVFSIFTPATNRFLNVILPFNEDNQEYYNYLWPLRNGHIIAPLNDYVLEFKPELLSRFTVQPGNVLLNELVTGDSTYLLTGQAPAVRLKATDNSFSVEYSVLGPVHENQYVYQYRLGGYEDQWTNASAQTAAWYNKLPGGDYVFQVRALTLNNQATPVRSLAIHIDTFFYNTRLFRLLLLLTLLGLGYTLYRYRVKQTARLHHLQVQASRLERDKTEIQYQNLINHLNPHFLFNSLTSLNSLIILDPKQASRFLQKLSTIYRYILRHNEKETVSVANELAFVQHYIDLQQAQFEDGLQITVEVPDVYRSREIVPVTLQNLFENAIKHNTTEDESPLRIRVYVADEYLYVVNNLQKKPLVNTSNKQGLDSLKKLYTYLSDRPLLTQETPTEFVVKIPLL